MLGLDGLAQGVGNIIASMVSGVFNYIGQQETNATNKAISEGVNQTNRDIAAETNAANIEMTNATNENNYRMNKENNELQMELAEKAYQRSTASNQIAELVKAGYSPQQAKAIVGGSGSPATMPLPTTTASVDTAPQAQPYTVEGYQYTSPMQAAASDFGSAAGAMAQTATSMVGQFVQDCVSPFGGFFGQTGAMPFNEIVGDAVSKGLFKQSDLYGKSFYDACEFIMDKYTSSVDENGEFVKLSAPKEIVNKLTSLKKQYATNRPVAAALDDKMRSYTTDGTSQSALRLSHTQELTSLINQHLAELDESAQEMALELQKSQYQSTATMLGIRNEYDIKRFNIELKRAAAQLAECDNEDWKKNVAKQFLSSASVQANLALIEEIQSGSIVAAYGEEDGLLRSSYGYLQILDDMHILEYGEKLVDDLTDLIPTKGLNKVLNSLAKRL